MELLRAGWTESHSVTVVYSLAALWHCRNSKRDYRSTDLPIRFRQIPSLTD